MIQRLASILSLVLLVAILFEVLQIWIAPEADQIDRLRLLMVLILVEFVLVHSGIFMSVFPWKLNLIILVPFYGLFIWTFNSMVPNNEVFWIYLGVVATRLRFAFSNRSDEQLLRNFLFSFAATALWMAAFVPCMIFPDYIPKLGLTPDFLVTTDYPWPSSKDYVWGEGPHIPMAMATAYLTGLILLEFVFYVRPFKLDMEAHRG